MELPAVPQPWRYWLLLGSYLLFLLLGTAIFGAVEAPREAGLREALQGARAGFVLQHRDCLAEPSLERLLEQVLDADNYGVSALGNVSEDENWDFSSALFFAASVLSTTGYGHTVPLSDGGKLFCILYTLLGLPATLLLATCLLQQLLGLLSHRPVRYLQARWGIPAGHAALGHATALGLGVLGFFILLPALCFWALESGWTFLESVYFCFISLSTIGLGDYVPGRGSSPALRHLYKISITCYLLLGLLAMLLALETIYELREVHSLVRFFAPPKTPASPSSVDDDRLEILSHDQLGLATICGHFPSESKAEDEADGQAAPPDVPSG
ncbi:potassium channel subfamily K member 7 [Emydura macquarii macquarii]|uniref:potassium channel subfamily K member 7 n=1 Tax=Emydura macquarii macquarii TaxID=1129001 RepID=UPI00352B9D87